MITQQQQDVLSSLKETFEQSNEIVPAASISRIQSALDNYKAEVEQKNNKIKEQNMIDEARLNIIYDAAANIATTYGANISKSYSGFGDRRRLYVNMEYYHAGDRRKYNATLHIEAISAGFNVGYPTYNGGKDILAESTQNVIDEICNWIVQYKKLEIK